MIAADYATQAVAGLCENHMPAIFAVRILATSGNASQVRCASSARPMPFRRKIATFVVVNLVRRCCKGGSNEQESVDEGILGINRRTATLPLLASVTLHPDAGAFACFMAI
jgi:hypothetical protein